MLVCNSCNNRKKLEKEHPELNPPIGERTNFDHRNRKNRVTNKLVKICCGSDSYVPNFFESDLANGIVDVLRSIEKSTTDPLLSRLPLSRVYSVIIKTIGNSGLAVFDTERCQDDGIKKLALRLGYDIRRMLEQKDPRITIGMLKITSKGTVLLEYATRYHSRDGQRG
jgi:hypothetical protein